MYAGAVDISKTVNIITEKFIELIKTKDEKAIVNEIIIYFNLEMNIEEIDEDAGE